MIDLRRRQRVRDALTQAGFVVAYETTAVAIFRHPDRPGALVRIGNTRVVGERDGLECYRASTADFSLPGLIQGLDAPDETG